MRGWYGLKVDGEIIAVLLWAGTGEPTVFDFTVALFGSSHYEVVPVRVEEEERSYD